MSCINFTLITIMISFDLICRLLKDNLIVFKYRMMKTVSKLRVNLTNDEINNNDNQFDDIELKNRNNNNSEIG
jgi:hypothetical protein